MVSQSKFLTKYKVWSAMSFKKLIQLWRQDQLEWKKARSTILEATAIAKVKRGKELNYLQLWQWKWKGQET